ncbi:MAG: type II toxin-antitoxin system RelE/ParE family toxin [Dehalococcoidia bacterium]
MIKSFADSHTRELFTTGHSRQLASEVVWRARRKLEYINLATKIDDLKVPPGNRLHKPGGNRRRQHAIAINEQWRIYFRFIEGSAYDVEITDYH